MKSDNRPFTLIAWMKGQFVASDAPLGRPGDYYLAVNRTDELMERLMERGVSMKFETIMDLLLEAFVAGFESSREGRNFEHCTGGVDAHLSKVAPDAIAEIVKKALSEGKL